MHRLMSTVEPRGLHEARGRWQCTRVEAKARLKGQCHPKVSKVSIVREDGSWNALAVSLIAHIRLTLKLPPVESLTLIDREAVFM